MAIISVRDNEENRWKRNAKTKIKTKNKNRKNNRDRSYSERMRAKWFCCALKLGFFQLICQASLIFRSNLELPSSIR